MKLCVLGNLDLGNWEKRLKEKGVEVAYGDEKDCEAVLLRNVPQIDEKFLEDHKNLRYVIRAGVGLDNVDVEKCEKRGIKIVFAPGSNAFSVAELFVFHVLNAKRHLCTAILLSKAGILERSSLLGSNIFGKTIGILGLGNIGKEIVKRLYGWEVKFKAFDVFKDEEFAKEYGVEFVNLEKLFEESDIVAVCVPLNENTKGMVNFSLLKRMRKGSLLVNLSRGEVVVGKDVLKALDEGILEAYCTDVLEDEEKPTEIDRKILSHPKCFITPHLGANTKEALKRMVDTALENFLKEISQD